MQHASHMKRLLLKIETHTSHISVSHLDSFITTYYVFIFIKCSMRKGYSSAFLFMLPPFETNSNGTGERTDARSDGVIVIFTLFDGFSFGQQFVGIAILFIRFSAMNTLAAHEYRCIRAILPEHLPTGIELPH